MIANTPDAKLSSPLRLRRRLGVRLAMLILTFYFGFAAMIAFFPKILAIGAPFSVGFVLIVLHIAAVIFLNIYYLGAAKGEGTNRKPD